MTLRFFDSPGLARVVMVRMVALLAIACAAFLATGSARAQGTAFTYQGQLESNSVSANGLYDFQFILHTALTGGTQTGSALTNLAVGVTNGLFTTTVDFGSVFGTSPLYLEIDVRTNGGSSFTALNPRQLITSAPYAVQALRATAYTGGVLDSQLTPNIPLLNGSPVFTGTATFSNAVGKFSGTLSGTFSGTSSGIFSGSSSGTFAGTSTGTFVGNGANVTNLNVTNLVGIVLANPNWQLIQTSGQQAVSGNNYLTTNQPATTLNLPTSPSVGDTIRISGGGAGGWVIGQNAGQSVITVSLNLQGGQYFNAYSNSQSWHAVCSSYDGITLNAAYGTGFIYYSPDGGFTWTKSDAPSANWTALACSSDGTHLIAGQNGGYLYTSTNSGVNWVQRTGSTYAYYYGVASSSDGTKLVAAAGTSANLYVSDDSGVTWTARSTAEYYSGVASSANGVNLAACTQGEGIFVSADSGVTWTNRGPSSIYFKGIASSADGNRLVAVPTSGLIYTSGDAGVTWTTHATNAAWTCVTSSTDGMELAAAYSTGFIYTSGDSGQTWVPRTNSFPLAQAWSAIASSASGSRLIAAISTGNIYTSIASTTIGSAGSLTGRQYSALNLQYIGNGQWMPLDFIGTITEK